MSMFEKQNVLEFPKPLTDKYRPATIDGFVGLDKVKRVMTKFAANPYPEVFLFSGPSGTGKTAMAFCVADLINAEVHHIPSQSCTVEQIGSVAAKCQRAPWNFFGEKAGKPARMHCVIVDEADQMSPQAQLKFLSLLDGTAPCPTTAFFFTCNALDRFEPRFLSRTKQLPFSSQGLAKPTAELLETIWKAEGGPVSDCPNFLRLVQDSKNNIRDAVNSLAVELMAA